MSSDAIVGLLAGFFLGLMIGCLIGSYAEQSSKKEKENEARMERIDNMLNVLEEHYEGVEK